MKRFISLYFLLFFSASLFTAFGQDTNTPSIHPANEPEPNTKGWWKDRSAALNKNLKENPCDLLFIGDSITQGWEGAGREVWAAYFAPFNAANFGIGGDRTEQVLARMEESKLETPHAPRVCVIMIGTNNTGHYNCTQPAEDTARGIKAIALGVTKKFPTTQVILFNIFPRGNSSTSEFRIHNEKINAILNQWQARNVKVVNINQAFLNEDGTFKPGLMGDLVHLTPKGYEIWAQELVPYLKKYFPAITKVSLEKKEPALAASGKG